MSRSDYHERREARIDRLKHRAEAARRESESRHKAASAISDHIPFGQPILVGHHSEKRHRGDLAKIDNHIGKAVAASERAEHYEHRAQAAESNDAISSDNPDAIDLLREKLESLQEKQQRMKATNAAWRKSQKKPGYLDETSDNPDDPHPSGLCAYDRAFARAFKQQYSWEKGPYPAYELQNNNANIRRVEQRIAELEKQADQETVESEYDGFTVVENVEENRVQIIFPGKPPAETRTILKQHGFRWSPMQGAWQRQLNANGVYAAGQVAKQIGARDE